ncbi:hypothetical protein C5S39_04430 [Candidatus Methanophagaceae archaeon]|nr:hypothetical protein C5S39_04430 [Methanophagales archaeon]
MKNRVYGQAITKRLYQQQTDYRNEMSANKKYAILKPFTSKELKEIANSMNFTVFQV